MPYADSASSNRISPFAAGAVGFGAGVAGDQAVMAIRQARSRANWGLGIGLGLAGLTLANSGNLQSQSQSAVNIANQANALAFTAGGATGAEVGALRAQFVNLASLVGQVAFYANPWSFFSNQPTQVTGVGTAAASTVTTVSTQTASNTSGLAVILLIGIAALAILY